MQHVRRFSIVALRIVASLAFALAGSEVAPASDIAHFKLANGLEVVVIPDHRTPVVTHMLWYRVGAAG